MVQHPARHLPSTMEHLYPGGEIVNWIRRELVQHLDDKGRMKVDWLESLLEQGLPFGEYHQRPSTTPPKKDQKPQKSRSQKRIEKQLAKMKKYSKTKRDKRRAFKVKVGLIKNREGPMAAKMVWQNMRAPINKKQRERRQKDKLDKLAVKEE